MGASDKWRERFGISDRDLAEAGVKTGVAALHWCLMNGKIPEPEYLEWAMRHFNLPSVSGDFFTAPSDLPFWNRVKNLHGWTELFFPLTDWDGVLLIGCVEPPTEFHFSERHQFVLASARHLLLLWSRLNPPVVLAKSGVSPTPADEPSEPMINALPDGFVFKEPLGLSKTTAPELTGLSASIDFAKIHEVLPEGLVASGATTIMSTKAMTDQTPAMPEGITLARFSDPPVPKAPSLPTPPASSPPNLRPQAPAHVATQVSEPQTGTGLKGDGETGTGSETSSASWTDSNSNTGTGDGAMEQTRTGFTIVTPDAHAISKARSVEELAGYALVHVLKTFDGAMILHLDGTKLKPWKWSEFLTAPKNASVTELGLDTPSIFRIVHRTSLPFHGPIASSAVNDAFFSAFMGTGKAPPQVTLVPIIHQKQFHGMIMGVSKKSTSYKTVLPVVEQIAEEVGQMITNIKNARVA